MKGGESSVCAYDREEYWDLYPIVLPHHLLREFSSSLALPGQELFCSLVKIWVGTDAIRLPSFFSKFLIR